MNYMEADVEQARVVVRALIRAQVVSLNEQKSLETLISAALEGAKVSRLVADNAALVQALHSAKQPHAKGCLFTRGVGTTGQQVRPCPCGVDALFETSSPGAALLAEHAREVSALQAQVAELAGAKADAVLASSEQRARAERAEASLRQEQATVASLRQHVVEIRSERDALRAQVTPMREALEWIERETHPEDGLTFERIHAKAAGALSAPPAETKGVKS